MKLPTPRTRAAAADDTFVQGMEATIMIALFFGLGFGLDRWLGTTPWLMITFVLLGAVGLFARFKYQYDERMAAYDREHQARTAARRAAASAPRPDGDRTVAP